MRAIIDHAGFESGSIRPNELLDRYRALVEADVGLYLADAARVECSTCPGCGSGRGEAAFERFGLGYRHCLDCGSLWITPRPDDVALAGYYRQSEAERFWQGELARRTGEARLARVIEPRIDWISDAVAEHRPGGRGIGDVGTHLSAFAERFANIRPFERHLSIDPITPDLSVPGLETVDRPLGEAGLDGTLDAITLLDVADRTSDPDSLVAQAASALAPGGLMFVTAILASGFDIQVLWDKAQTVFPPDRLNVLSATGLTALITRHGFEVIEFSTPGAFDLRAVAAAREQSSDLALPRFIETLIARRGKPEHERFQSFLQGGLLSSFGRVVARRIL